MEESRYRPLTAKPIKEDPVMERPRPQPALPVFERPIPVAPLSQAIGEYISSSLGPLIGNYMCASELGRKKPPQINLDDILAINLDAINASFSGEENFYFKNKFSLIQEIKNFIPVI